MLPTEHAVDELPSTTYVAESTDDPDMNSSDTEALIMYSAAHQPIEYHVHAPTNLLNAPFITKPSAPKKATPTKPHSSPKRVSLPQLNQMPLPTQLLVPFLTQNNLPASVQRGRLFVNNVSSSIVETGLSVKRALVPSPTKKATVAPQRSIALYPMQCNFVIPPSKMPSIPSRFKLYPRAKITPIPAPNKSLIAPALKPQNATRPPKKNLELSLVKQNARPQNNNSANLISVAEQTLASSTSKNAVRAFREPSIHKKQMGTPGPRQAGIMAHSITQNSILADGLIADPFPRKLIISLQKLCMPWDDPAPAPQVIAASTQNICTSEPTVPMASSSSKIESPRKKQKRIISTKKKRAVSPPLIAQSSVRRITRSMATRTISQKSGTLFSKEKSPRPQRKESLLKPTSPTPEQRAAAAIIPDLIHPFKRRRISAPEPTSCSPDNGQVPPTNIDGPPKSSCQSTRPFFPFGNNSNNTSKDGQESQPLKAKDTQGKKKVSIVLLLRKNSVTSEWEVQQNKSAEKAAKRKSKDTSHKDDDHSGCTHHKQKKMAGKKGGKDTSKRNDKRA